jgi:hypothetical protein
MIRSGYDTIPTRIPFVKVESRVVVFQEKSRMGRKLVAGINGFESESFRQTLA